MNEYLTLLIEYIGDSKSIIYATKNLKKAYDDSDKLNTYITHERRVFYALKEKFQEYSENLFSTVQPNQYTPQELIDILVNGWLGVYEEKMSDCGIPNYKDILDRHKGDEWFLTARGSYTDRYYSTESITLLNEDIDAIDLYHQRIY